MSSRKLWTKHAFFSILEHGAVRVLDAATTFVLIRALDTTDLGVFSVYQSWVAILLLFLPAVELVLFREYGHLKRENKLSEELGYYRRFNYIKLAIVVGLVTSLAALPRDIDYLSRWALLALAFALPFSQAFYSYLREPLRFEMLQERVAIISALQRVAVLASIGTAAWFAPNNAVPLALGAVGCFVFFGIIWRAASVVPISFPPKGSFLPRIGSVLFGSVLWIHLNGVLFQASQTLDIAALNWQHADLKLIAHYGITLKVANFFQVIPIALMSSFGVFLGKTAGETRDDRERSEQKLVLKYTGFMLLACGALFFIGLIIGPPVVEFLSRGKMQTQELETALKFYKWQLLGVLTLAVSHPLSTFLMARAPLRKLCLQVFLPWAMAAAGIYLWSAQPRTDAIEPFLTTAQANVVCYLVLALFLIVFALKPTRIR